METTINQTTPVKSVLRELQLSEIAISKTNPRKVFEENALRELSLSIAEHGVLQPILVRPKDGGIELVCGERRFRASLMAGLESIPCNIREMGDDEAFELQIIENLERKDVHPLDEADAFKKMLDCGRYTLADIAAKMAKPEKYIVNRLKLNELIDEIKKDFFDGICNIGHAIVIAKLDGESQLEIFNNYKDGRVHGYGTLKDLLQTIEQKYFELDTATFPIDQDFEHALACTGCAHRSINNPLLFEDMESGDSCFNKSCFHAKTDAHLLQALQSKIDSGSDIIFAKDWNGTPKESITKFAEENKIKIAKQQDDFSTWERPGYVKKQALFVAGSEKGTIKDVWVPKSSESGNSGESPTDQIRKIEIKAVRSLELDEEKIHQAIKEVLHVEVEQYNMDRFRPDHEFTNTMAIYHTIESLGTWILGPVFKKLGIEYKGEYKSYDELSEAIAKITSLQMYHLMVYITNNKASGSSTRKSTRGQLMHKLANMNPKISVPEIEAKQKAAADIRIARNAEKIAELQKQIVVAKSSKDIKKSTNQ
ncbi:MAG: ParB/RepB/Spo0J family partition protein [Chryseobacterium sp.]|nr:MAG: ParB/RepB/Spo0J family partition protein [Chryseobacterium sp.]